MLAIDGYADIERIGHGGLGDVYRATRVSTGGVVAIKVLRDISDESVAWNRTRRELTALVSLGGHAHVIRLLELLEDTPGLVMEYAPGGSVAQLLEQRGGTLSVGEIALIGRHTASALAAAHDRGIVHRDVKPQNLLIDAYGQVKLCDFGIASLARTEEFRTRTSAISMRYASPEDLEDTPEIGPPSDVYSLGATLLHLAHGAPPTLKERLAPWTPPPTDDEELAALDQILAVCLHPTPSTRPSAHEVLERLEALEWNLHRRCRALDPADGAAELVGDPSAIALGGTPPDPSEPPPNRARPIALPDTNDDATLYRTGRRPATAPHRPAAAPPRRRWVTVGAGAAVTVVVVVGWLLWSSGDADAPTVSTTVAPSTSGTSGAPTALALAERPVGLVPLDDASVTWPFGQIGECLVQVPNLDTLQPIDCSEPHDLQRAATGVLPVGTTSPDTPDEAILERAVATSCSEDAALTATDLPLQLAQTHPSAESWGAGDRGYQCLVGVPGRRLTGSALDGS